MSTARRTQAERRATTRAAVLESACRLFGRDGFSDTSLEDIASEAGVTIRPIYHYFGSKLQLFSAVNDVMEQRIVEVLEQSTENELDAWRRYLALCEDPGFRRIVLLDGPNVLGRERWSESPVTRAVIERFGRSAKRRDASTPSDTAGETDASRANEGPGLAARMLVGALAEAAIAIAESEDPTATSRQAERLVAVVVSALSSDSTRHGPHPSEARASFTERRIDGELRA